MLNKLNLKDASEYLNISEKHLRHLVELDYVNHFYENGNLMFLYCELWMLLNPEN